MTHLERELSVLMNILRSPLDLAHHGSAKAMSFQAE